MYSLKKLIETRCVSVKDPVRVVTLEDKILKTFGVEGLIFIICLLTIALLYVSFWLRKEIKNNRSIQQSQNKDTINHQSTEPPSNIPNTCDVCGKETSKGYALCPTCFELLQQNKLSKCNNCGKWYKKGNMCNCAKREK